MISTTLFLQLNQNVTPDCHLIYAFVRQMSNYCIWTIIRPEFVSVRTSFSEDSAVNTHCVLRAWKSFKVDPRGQIFVFKTEIA